MSPRTPLAQALRKVFSFPFELFFLVARVATWPLSLVGKIPYARSCYFLFFLGRFQNYSCFLPPLDFYLLEFVVPNLTYILTSPLPSHFRFE